MVKCCEHVNCCIPLVWIWRIGLGKWRLSQKGSVFSPGLPPGPLPFPFSHSHFGAQTKGSAPQRLVVSIRTWAPRFMAMGFPVSAHVGPDSPTPSSAPSNCYQSPRDGFLQSIVLSVPCCYSNPRKMCVSNSPKQKHLCAILEILVGVPVYYFDQFSLTCGIPREVQREKTPLGKQVLPISAACLWIPVPHWMKAHGKAKNAWILIPSSSPAQVWEGEGSIQKIEVWSPLKFTSMKGGVSYLSMEAHISPQNSAPYTCPILRSDGR